MPKPNARTDDDIYTSLFHISGMQQEGIILRLNTGESSSVTDGPGLTREEQIFLYTTRVHLAHSNEDTYNILRQRFPDTPRVLSRPVLDQMVRYMREQTVIAPDPHWSYVTSRQRNVEVLVRSSADKVKREDDAYASSGIVRSVAGKSINAKKSRQGSDLPETGDSAHGTNPSVQPSRYHAAPSHPYLADPSQRLYTGSDPAAEVFPGFAEAYNQRQARRAVEEGGTLYLDASVPHSSSDQRNDILGLNMVPLDKATRRPAQPPGSRAPPSVALPASSAVPSHMQGTVIKANARNSGSQATQSRRTQGSQPSTRETRADEARRLGLDYPQGYKPGLLEMGFDYVTLTNKKDKEAQRKRQEAERRAEEEEEMRRQAAEKQKRQEDERKKQEEQKRLERRPPTASSLRNTQGTHATGGYGTGARQTLSASHGMQQDTPGDYSPPLPEGYYAPEGNWRYHTPGANWQPLPLGSVQGVPAWDAEIAASRETGTRRREQSPAAAQARGVDTVSRRTTQAGTSHVVPPRNVEETLQINPAWRHYQQRRSNNQGDVLGSARDTRQPRTPQVFTAAYSQQQLSVRDPLQVTGSVQDQAAQHDELRRRVMSHSSQAAAEASRATQDQRRAVDEDAQRAARVRRQARSHLTTSSNAKGKKDKEGQKKDKEGRNKDKKGRK